MKAAHEANQNLLQAIHDTLTLGPLDKTYRSCHNVQARLTKLNQDTGKPTAGEFTLQAYIACDLLAEKQGLGGLMFPVDQLFYNLGGTETEKILSGRWDGYMGALRRQWLHDLRELVRDWPEAIVEV